MNSSKNRKPFSGKMTSSPDLLAETELLTDVKAEPAQIESDIKKQSEKRSASSINQIEDSESFVSSESSGDEFRKNKREFLTSKLFIDE